MTDQPLNLDPIEARAAAATPGPWGTQRDLAGAYTVQARPRTTRYGMENDGDIATLAADRTDADNYANARFIAHAPADVKAMAAEIRRLRAELATARSQAIDWAADVIDAKLTVEPDHGRASALYELLLHLRGELPCTCARSQGLHEKDCRKYVPGHELISRHNALARYRRERAAAVVAHVVADDSDDPEHVDDCPGCQPAARP
jgi:hypothetical protein